MKISKAILLLTVFVKSLLTAANAQVRHPAVSKPPVTWDVIDTTNWDRYKIGKVRISSDGKHIAYRQGGQWVYSQANGKKKSVLTNNTDNIRFIGGTQLVYHRLGDTTRIVTEDNLKRVVRQYVGNDYSYVSEKGGRTILISLSKSNQLSIYKPATMTELTFQGVTQVIYNNNSEQATLWYLKQVRQKRVLHRLNLQTLSDREVAKTEGAFDNFQQSGNGEQLAGFEILGVRKRIFVYNTLTKSVNYFDGEACGLTGKESFSSSNMNLTFASEGKVLLFYRQNSAEPKTRSTITDTTKIKLNIWTYSDKNEPPPFPDFFGPIAHSDERLWGRNYYLCALNIGTGKVLRLEHENDGGRIDEINGVYSVIGKSPALIVNTIDSSLVKEIPVARFSKRLQLVNLLSGKLMELPLDRALSLFKYSPDGKYILCYSQEEKNYYSIDTFTGKKTTLTDSTQIDFINPMGNGTDNDFLRSEVCGIAGWIDGGKSALVYDQFDIWKLDMTGLTPPLCVTQNKGRSTKTTFRFVSANSEDGSMLYSNNVIDENDIVMVGQELMTKDQGFYAFDINGKIAPSLLSKGKYQIFNDFDREGHRFPLDGSRFSIAKAKGKGPFIFVRSHPKGIDLVYSKDLNHQQVIAATKPLEKYNGMTRKILSWQTLDGRFCQGMLFKPENFDSTKKYPVIVTYYEKNAVSLHAFDIPGQQKTWFAFMYNIGYFVSNGYIVFVPDMYYRVHHPAQSVYNSIIPGITELLKEPGVDSAHIGATGMSFGGCQTLWLLPRTGKMFAAAIAESGISDYTSVGFFGWDVGISGQLRIEAMPWKRPDLYIENSPIYQADKIETPLMLVNNNFDGVCPVTQGIEMFKSLKKLGKPVWLLQYEEQGHGIYLSHKQLIDPENDLEPDVRDYRIRFQQFFDYYLKGAPAPEWMFKSRLTQWDASEADLQLVNPNLKP